MQRLFFSLLFLASAHPAAAHFGNENSTEIRVYVDSMRVIVRTSVPFAWSLLGQDAPLMADEAGQAIARPLLAGAAPSLLAVTSAGNPMTPTFVYCMFELQDDVAFIYNFKRPTEWPVVVTMGVFKHGGNLETGTIAVFDYTASRHARDVEPFAQKVVDHRNPSLSFALEPLPLATKPASTPASPRQTAPRKSIGTVEIMVVLFVLLGVGGIGFLAYRRLKDG